MINWQKPGKKMQDVGDKISKTGKTLTKTVTAPLVGAGVLAAKSFADVDKTMVLANKTMGNTNKAIFNNPSQLKISCSAISE